MKGGKTKSEVAVAAAAAAAASSKHEEDENEEEEEEDEEKEDGGEGEGEGEGEGRNAPAQDSEDRPKLAEGFYEIEDVRKKRVRKGQLQYLIKWRGWPETANTWEPIENLQSCADIIEAFEESIRASKSYRKRRRKSGALQIQSKKKRNSSKLEGDSLLPHTPARPIPANGSGAENTAAEKADGEVEGDQEHANNNSRKMERGEHHWTENGSAGSLESGQKKRMNDVDANCNEHQRAGCMEDNSGNISIHFPESRPSEEDGSTDGHSKVECTQSAQKSRFTGAKKRKSGSVRRFKQDIASCDQDDNHNAAAGNENRGELLAIEDVESVGDEAGDRNKLDDSRIPPCITKIIRPIGYTASISNNVQDVTVTFMALRSDGKEVVIDNKFLKANNPLLLISFYEQHLRYSPPT